MVSHFARRSAGVILPCAWEPVAKDGPSAAAGASRCLAAVQLLGAEALGELSARSCRAGAVLGPDGRIYRRCSSPKDWREIVELHAISPPTSEPCASSTQTRPVWRLLRGASGEPLS